MMKTTNHFKIWFSKDKNIWLPIENQLRLIRHRVKNPSHTLYLIGADRLLSEDSIQTRKEFCSKFNIIYLDLDNDLPSIIQKESEDIKKEDDLNLLELANAQINTFFSEDPKMGNLAAASDLVRWVSVLLKRGIYSDLDTEIDFKEVPELIDSDFIIPCQKVWEGIRINNNFIAASETSVLADFIRKKLIQNATISKNLTYTDPRHWVHLLYGPNVIKGAICEHYGLNEELEYESVKAYDRLAEEITSIISTSTHKLFRDENTHIMGAGDVSWATNSQEKTSEEMLHAANMISRLWKRKKELASEKAMNPTISNNAPKDPSVDENQLKKLKENINLAILGKKTVNCPKTELPADDVTSYLSWMNKHATGTRFFTRFTHLYHGDSGVKRARDLLEIANNPASSYEEILTHLQEAFDNSSKRRHSLSRYLMAQFNGEGFENLKKMDDDAFGNVKSVYQFHVVLKEKGEDSSNDVSPLASSKPSI